MKQKRFLNVRDQVRNNALSEDLTSDPCITNPMLSLFVLFGPTNKLMNIIGRGKYLIHNVSSNLSGQPDRRTHWRAHWVSNPGPANLIF